MRKPMSEGEIAKKLVKEMIMKELHLDRDLGDGLSKVAAKIGVPQQKLASFLKPIVVEAVEEALGI